MGCKLFDVWRFWLKNVVLGSTSSLGRDYSYIVGPLPICLWSFKSLIVIKDGVE